MKRRLKNSEIKLKKYNPMVLLFICELGKWRICFG